MLAKTQASRPRAKAPAFIVHVTLSVTYWLPYIRAERKYALQFCGHCSMRASAWGLTICLKTAQLLLNGAQTMPSALAVDYEQLRSDFLKGVPLKDLADQCGINIGSLRSRAQREGWTQLKHNSAQKVLNVAQSHVERFTAKHLDSILGYTQGAIDNLITRGYDHDPDSLMTLVNVVDKIDLIARRSLRLDSQLGPKGIALQVNVSGAASVSSHDASDDINVQLSDAEQLGSDDSASN